MSSTQRLRAALVPLGISNQDFDHEVQNGSWSGIGDLATTQAPQMGGITTDTHLIATKVVGYSGGGSCPSSAMQQTIAAKLKSIP